MDNILWNLLEQTADSSIPQSKDHHQHGVILTIPGVPDKSYQEWVVRQPIRLGGFGLRSQCELSPAAFIGAVEQILPSFVGAKGICPQLAHVTGSMEESDHRWQQLFSSGSRTGYELQQAWQLLQNEARAMCDFLGIDAPLSVAPEGLAEGGLNGSMRKMFLNKWKL